MSKKNMYYDYRKLNSCKALFKVVASLRGLGKTYGKVNELFALALRDDFMMLYLVENEPMLKELCQNDGDKFITQLYDNDVFCKALKNGVEFDVTKLSYKAGIVYYDKKPRIQLYDLAHYGKIKRLKHNNIRKVIFDEFIELSERANRFDIVKALNSVVQSCCRLNEVEVWLLGNTENPNSPFVPLFDLDKSDNLGKIYTLERYGAKAVVHFVDCEKEYPEYYKAYKESSSGKMAAFLEQTSLDENQFGTMPEHLKGDIGEELPHFQFTLEGSVYKLYKTPNDEHGRTIRYVGPNKALPSPLNDFKVARKQANWSADVRAKRIKNMFNFGWIRFYDSFTYNKTINFFEC